MRHSPAAAVATTSTAITADLAAGTIAIGAVTASMTARAAVC